MQGVSMKLNLGAGAQPLPGYENWDRKTGQEVFPLNVPDGSCEEIRASHVLEHFSHKQVSQVVNEWVRKLQPGGVLKVAVPNFEWIARHYIDGEPINSQGYTMGGQVDEDDFHGTIFDDETLSEVFLNAGLERIGQWKSEIQDCAALPVSLNLMGYKPATSLRTISGVIAVLSAPRFGPMAHVGFALQALQPLGIPYEIGQGAYWHQVLSEMIEKHLGDRYVLTLDYDTVFSSADVMEMYRLMEAVPEIDALCPVQARRNGEFALFTIHDDEGKLQSAIPAVEFQRHLTQIHTGHFGCTLFRVSSLAKLPRPWMLPIPNNEGRWTEGCIDADISFWKNWEHEGLSLYLANKVVVGHLQEVIAWPDTKFRSVMQTMSSYKEHGIPPGVRR